jgi:hypothetical protein
MAFLGENTNLVGHVRRAKSNALTMALSTSADKEVAAARQKGGAGVLFGFKNGGRGDYFLSAGDDVLDIAVAGTTTIRRGELTIGRIVPADGAARIEDGNNNVVAVIHGHEGSKNDDAWIQRLTASDGTSMGALTLVRRTAGFQDLYKWLVAEVWLNLNVNQRAPSAGVVLALDAPVPEHEGDLLAAACVDAAMLPRGYLATG